MDLVRLMRREFRDQLYIPETREDVTPLATLGAVVFRTNPLLPPRIVSEELEKFVDSLGMRRFEFANSYESGEGLILAGIQGFLKDYPIILYQISGDVYKKAVSTADKSVSFDKERLWRYF